MTEQLDKTPSGRSRFPDGFRILQGRQEFITYQEYASIRIWQSDVATHYDLHTHSAIEMILPLRGTADYRVEEESYRISAGEILIVPSGCLHSVTEPDETQRYLFLFEPDPLLTLQDIPPVADMMRTPVFLHGDTELQSQVRDVLMKVIDIYNEKQPMWNTLCYAHLLEVYALLGRHFWKDHTHQGHTASRSIDPAIMNTAVSYINEHYMDDLSLETVADFAGFSKYYFSRMFKQYTGVSFLDYLTRKRMNVATDLLVRTNQPIRTIALSSGFGSMATFNRVFREQKSCTPTQFRAIYGLNYPAGADALAELGE